MQRSSSRLFPLFIILVVVAIIIFGIVSLGRALFHSDKPVETQPVDNGRQALLDTSVGHSVQLMTRGPIVADEEFKSYTIRVSPSARSMTVYTGYLDSIDEQKKLDNNHKAYEEFVYALDKANMMKGDMPSDDAENDLRGICASGYVYEYSVLVDGDAVKRLWTSTCSGSKGTLDASVEQLNDLFFAQIPGYEKLIPFKSNPLSLRF